MENGWVDRGNTNLGWMVIEGPAIDIWSEAY